MWVYIMHRLAGAQLHDYRSSIESYRCCKFATMNNIYDMWRKQLEVMVAHFGNVHVHLCVFVR